jgi:hypothetical protein
METASGTLWRGAALQRVMDARYDQLAALDLAIASYDPQQGLFPDFHEERSP